MNWKSITTHALLLLVASIAGGFFEPRPDQPQALLLAYLGTEALLLVAYAGIFAHLAYRVARRPFAHAFLTVLLSEAIAIILISLVPLELPPDPLPLLVIGYSVLLVSLIVGTLIGTRFRLAGRGAAA